MARTDELAQLGEAARGYLRDSRAPATVRAYRQDWAHFTAWCDRLGLESLPAAPDTVVGYLTAYAGDLSCASLQRRLTSISQAHKAAGWDDPPPRHRLVRRAWEGIRRVHGTAPNRKAPLRAADIRTLVATCDVSRLGGLRDRAPARVRIRGGVPPVGACRFGRDRPGLAERRRGGDDPPV